MEVKIILQKCMLMAKLKMLWSEIATCMFFLFFLITQSLISPDALPRFILASRKSPLNREGWV